jgi:phosphonate transport system permease protein
MTFAGVFGGFSDLANLVRYMLPPNFDKFPEVFAATRETLWMAVLGTFASCIICVPLSLAAARNTSPHPVVFVLARGIITVMRAVPDLVMAAIFVRAFGIGPLPGIFALALHSIGMIGKLFADAIEEIDEAPREATLATGASSRQAIITSVLPQVFPSMIATALYRLDINVRSSAVLGIVGAGGVGFVIQTSLRTLDYQRALAAVAVIFVVIISIEVFSARLRKSVIGEQPGFYSVVKTSNRKQGRMTRDHRLIEDAARNKALSPPLTFERRLRLSYLIGLMALVSFAWVSIKIPITDLFRYGADAIETTGRLFPPDFARAKSEGLVRGISETVAIGVISTLLGTVIAFPLGLLSARNIVVRKFVYAISRLVLLVTRSIPELIIAVMFVSAMGLGPIPGTLALTVVTASFMAKLIADSLEEVSPFPREALVAVGATRVQEFIGGVLPQAMPSLVGQLLYMLDYNIRSSTILGIVGGGGIGSLLFGSLRVFELQVTGAIIVSIFCTVYAIELIGNWVRAQLR